MCGIVGYYGLNKSEHLLKLMNDTQSHRGPDGEGQYNDKQVGLAQRRLAIIDCQDGTQPMFSQDGNFVLVYNGEIYNYLELKTQLEALGRKFVTNSDTEIVLQAFEEWGKDSFDKFNGMFGLAIYDKQKNKLTLARDHFGIKPLYFAQIETPNKQKAILFASEIKSILATNLVKARANDKIIYRYLKFRIHESTDETFFEDINHLLPGEVLEIDAQGLKISKFTNLEQELKEIALTNEPYSEAKAEEYHQRLLNSVKSRLQSEVTIGTSLSGGLDSSTVVALVNKIMAKNNESAQAIGKQQNTFSAIFPNSSNDEEKYVDDLLKQSGDMVKPHKIKPTADQFKHDLLDFIKTQEEPTISTGPYAQYTVMKEACKHVTVLLDGQGADETMAGYVPYYFVYLRQLLKQKRWWKFTIEFFSSIDVLFKLGKNRIKDKLTFRKTTVIDPLLNPEFANKYSDQTFSTEKNNLKHRLIEDTFYNSLPALLRYEDKNTMRFGIEGRVPFLDKDLIKFIFSLADEAIISKGWNKNILRDAMINDLPKTIAKRRNKIGFTTPEHEWFIRLKNYIYSIFLSEEFISRKYFSADQVSAAFESFVSGKSDTSTLVFWRILNIELWLREYIDDKKPVIAKKVKTDFEPNHGKQLDITVGKTQYRRYALRTDLVSAKDEIEPLILKYVVNFFEQLSAQNDDHQKMAQNQWQLFISEKIIAIMQGRSYFIWDIKPSWWARLLSRFVARTPAGIGLGSPFTMQLAINEAGLLRILWASLCGGIGKIFGKRGVFYNVAGSDVRAIDGPTEYSVYPANVSAKLAPKNSKEVAQTISETIRAKLPEKYAINFQGTVIIDANDIGRNILGTDVALPPAELEAIFADNPLGQSTEQTPISVVFTKKN